MDIAVIVHDELGKHPAARIQRVLRVNRHAIVEPPRLKLHMRHHLPPCLAVNRLIRHAVVGDVNSLEPRQVLRLLRPAGAVRPEGIPCRHPRVDRVHQPPHASLGHQRLVVVVPTDPAAEPMHLVRLGGKFNHQRVRHRLVADDPAEPIRVEVRTFGMELAEVAGLADLENEIAGVLHQTNSTVSLS